MSSHRRLKSSCKKSESFTFQIEVDFFQTFTQRTNAPSVYPGTECYLTNKMLIIKTMILKTTYGKVLLISWAGCCSLSQMRQKLCKRPLKLSQRPPKIPYVKNQTCYNSSKRREDSSFASKSLVSCHFIVFLLQIRVKKSFDSYFRIW